MSSSRPSSARSRPRLSRGHRPGLPRRTHDARDRGGHLVPPAGFDVELLPAQRRQAIELRAAVVLGRAVLERDPPALDQAVQRRIQRPLLHQQHVVRSLLDRLGNGVAVRRADPQRSQNQHVQRALQQLDAFLLLPGVFQVDILGESLRGLHLECQGERALDADRIAESHREVRRWGRCFRDCRCWWRSRSRDVLIALSRANAPRIAGRPRATAAPRLPADLGAVRATRRWDTRSPSPSERRSSSSRA